MTGKVTLEKVEQLAAQLSPREQLKLFSLLSGQLSISLSGTVDKKDLIREAAAVLLECDQAAAAFTQRTDSASTIRRLRAERRQRTWQNES